MTADNNIKEKDELLLKQIEYNCNILRYLSGHGNNTILENLSFKAEAGKIYGLTGNTGIGKSTFLRSIAGLNRSPQIEEVGYLRINDTDSLKLGSGELLKLNKRIIGYFFQQVQTSFNPRVRIGTYLQESARKTLSEEELCDKLSKFNINSPERCLNSLPHSLSGGELQRIAMLALQLKNPDIILADEPFNSLDPKNVDLFKKLMIDFRRKGAIVFIASHRMKIINELSDVMMRIANRQLVRESGNAYEYTSEVNTDPENSFGSGSDTIIQLDDICFTYDTEDGMVLKNLNLSVYRNEIIGIHGASGVGKSTLAKLFTGDILPVTGSIYDAVSGREMHNLSNKERSNLIQCIPQDPFGSVPEFQSLYELISDTQDSDYNEALTVILNIIAYPRKLLHRRISQLSGGQRQLGLLIIAVLKKPSLLILDESFSALDREMTRKAIELVLHMKSIQGMSSIIISHNLELYHLDFDRKYELDGQLISTL